MTKLRIVFVIFFILLVVPIYRYYLLSIDRELFIEAADQRSNSSELNIYPRKKIYDRFGTELAADIIRTTLLFNSQKDKDIALEVLGGNSTNIFLNTNRRLYLENRLNQSTLKKIMSECNCAPIMEPRFKRYYPYGSIYGPIIGFSGTDGGLEGIEKIENSKLTIKKRKSSFIQSLRGEKLSGQIDDYISVDESEGLNLTLDTNLQFKLFEEMKKAIVESKAKGGSAVIMNAENGHILAMVSLPTFNPNDPARVIQRNKVIEDFFEPGSLIKPITLAGAIKLNLIEKDSVIDTNPGFITLSGYKRSEAGGKNFGKLKVSEIISKSSQVGTAKISVKFSSEEIRKNLRDFGFNKPIDIEWITNSIGNMIDSPKLYDIDKASLGYGYSVTSNSIQIARAYSVFANEGIMVEPRIYLDSVEKRTRITSKDIADFILDSLRMTVIEGTADNLINEKVNIAGKTGTSEKYIEGVGYAEEKYISSFASIFPYEKPKFIMVVLIDEPDPNNYFGGIVSAPVVARLSQFMERLNYL